MDDKRIEKAIRTLEGKSAPVGLKERLLQDLLNEEKTIDIIRLTPIQRWFFVKPLRAACILSVFLSGTLWVIFGSNYASLISGLAGVR